MTEKSVKGEIPMLKLFERYFKLKQDVSVIEAKVKALGFKSVEECATLLAINENLNLATNISNETSINRSTLSTVLARLIKNGLITNTADETYKNNPLKRQIYTPTQSGIELAAKVKKALEKA